MSNEITKETADQLVELMRKSGAKITTGNNAQTKATITYCNGKKFIEERPFQGRTYHVST